MTQSTAESDHPTILVVDDDPANILRIEQALHSLGAGFDVAGNGIQALDALGRLAGPHGLAGINPMLTASKRPVNLSLR